MGKIPEEAVKAPERIRVAQDAEGFWTCREAVSGSTEYVRADLALPHLPGVGVKKLEWTRGVVDIASPHPGMKYVACSTTPKGSWAFWLDHAPETRSVFTSEEAAKAAAQADYEARILSALEPSAARELALEQAARIAGNFLMLKTGLHVDKIVELEAAIRALSSPDHADAGKVEGDGWKPIDEAAKSGRIVRIAYNRDDVTMADAFYRDGKWHAACVFYRSGVGKPPYEFREHKVLESLVFAYRPLPSAPASEGAE